MTVVHADSTEDVVAALRDAAAAGRFVRVRGGGLTASAPTDGDLDLRLDRLSGVIEHRPADLVVTVRAGTSLDELDRALAEHGQRLPIEPFDRERRGTAGALIATAADGLLGNHGRRVRDIVLGVGAVLGNGERVQVGARVVKSVAGFDVTKALVGSRGVLAVITDVTFRVESRLPATVELHGVFASSEALNRAVRAADAEGSSARGLAAARSPAGALHVAARFEGPAARGASQRLAKIGLSPTAAAPLERWTALIGAAPERQVTTCSRITPLADCEDAAGWVVADVLRSRRWQTTSARALVPSVLWEPLRSAFDPDGRFRVGRGLGAP